MDRLKRRGLLSFSVISLKSGVLFFCARFCITTIVWSRRITIWEESKNPNYLSVFVSVWQLEKRVYFSGVCPFVRFWAFSFFCVCPLGVSCADSYRIVEAEKSLAFLLLIDGLKSGLFFRSCKGDLIPQPYFLLVVMVWERFYFLAFDLMGSVKK